jgi:hypothetical protein
MSLTMIYIQKYVQMHIYIHTQPKVYIYVYMADEQAVIGMTSHNSHLFNYFLWKYHFYLLHFYLHPLSQKHN